jgi:hypothetical protein
MTNCKAGDLAVFIKSYAGNEGKIVTCLRIATTQKLITDKYTFFDGPVWVLDQEVNIADIDTGEIIDKLPYGLDSYLRPIRDTEGEDEMLSIAGKPVKEIEKV